MATLTFDTTESSITANCEGLDSSYAYTRYFVWQLYDEYWEVVLQEKDNQMPPGGTSFSTIFYNLSSDTTYNILCGIYADPDYQQQFASLSGSATTNSPAPVTCNCDIWFNDSYSYTEELQVGSSYLYGGFFDPNNTLLTSIETDNTSSSVSPSTSFTAPSEDFYINYNYIDLNNNSYSYTTTGSSITISFNESVEYSPVTYKWTLDRSFVLYGQEVTFTNVSQGSHSIVINIYNNNKEVGNGSISISIASSNVWIYTDEGWQKVQPWIYTDEGWKKVKVWIHNGTNWSPC